MVEQLFDQSVPGWRDDIDRQAIQSGSDDDCDDDGGDDDDDDDDDYDCDYLHPQFTKRTLLLQLVIEIPYFLITIVRNLYVSHDHSFH